MVTDTMTEPTPDVIQVLAETGPTTKDTLPTITNAMVNSGIVEYFDLPTTTHSGGVSLGNTKTIFYAASEHSRKEVIESWLDENSEKVEGIDPLSLHRHLSQNLPSKWKEPSREILGPFDQMGGGDSTPEFRDCPFCEEEFQGDFPGHLPCTGVN